MQPPRQLATWNPDRDLWETDQLSIFGPLVAYSETLPRSGMTRDGRLYEHLTLAHPTTARGFSSSPSLPTPTASDADKARDNPAQARRNSPPLSAVGHLLPTPRTTDANGAGKHGTGGQDLRTTMTAVFPTPSAADGTGGKYNSTGHQPCLPGTVRELVGVEWGAYAPAVRRWEQLTRPAPPPTEPNRNGRPRLAAAFAEWMMGLPAEHVTNPTIGLSRSEQLKAIGNGVCPQQALAALAILDPRQAA